MDRTFTIKERSQEVNDKYQTLVLTFGDGRKAIFVGRAIVKHEGDINKLKVVEIELTAPKPLPPDFKFALLADGKEEADND